MDLVVRCLYKTIVMNGVDGACDVSDLKELLHAKGVQEHIPIPAPAKQRLVHKGSILTSGSLHDAGVHSGDHLVLLLHRPNITTPVKPVDTTPVPTAATIRSAIVAEARSRGLEHTIMEEPRRAARSYGMPMEAMALEVDNQLLQLIQALQGRTQGAGGRGGQQQAGGAAAPGGQQAQAQGPAAAGTAPRYLQPPAGGPLPGMLFFGMPPPPQPAPPPPAAPAAPPAIPEPDAQACSQLRDMGFGDAVVRKALLLHRNDMEAALNWLLQHGEDPAAAEPLTEEQLRQIYSRGPRGPPSEPEMVEQLVAMGFERNQAAGALRRFRNMDLALAYLLRAAEEGEGEGDARQEGPGGQQEGAAAAPAAAGQGGGEAGQGPQQQQQGDRAAAGVAPAEGGRNGEGPGDPQPGEGYAGGGQQQQHDEALHPLPMEVEHEGEHDDDEEDEDEGEEEDEEDDEEFTGDEDMPNVMEQLAGAGANRGTVLRIPLGGGALGLGGDPMPEDVLGAFGAPLALHGMGAAAPAMAVTRGPDGNELVLGAAGANMPPLMPTRGVMLGQPGAAGMAAGGGTGGLGAQLLDLPGLLQGGGDAGEDELVMQGMGLVQQLLNAVLRDALNGGEGGNAGARGQQR
ncbi:hypothetical protein Agub_g4636 [Astrephomene gubernaculifera]|uniref:UBA domain-containing protein n=1 Tax=Astrephomene gubernaculifera TaxID=47775 RepID=A0AAD3DL16_9CHLO|nr:hypothetical protein Agub_g4636 [Astrephomene gubernaculifera]